MTASGETKRELRRARLDALEEELIGELEGKAERSRFVNAMREPIAFLAMTAVLVILWRVASFEVAVLAGLACTYAKATIARPLR